MKNKIALIFPAFNEEKTIVPTIQSFFQYIPNALFVVVNNNSTDKTRQKAQKCCQDLKVNFIILDEPEQGKASALRQAFHKIDAEVYLICDADTTYPACQAQQLIEPILNHKADMVVGDRISGGYYKKTNKRLLHNFGNFFFCWLVNKLFQNKLNDILSGYRVLSRKFVQNYPILVKDFEIEIDITVHALDKRIPILELPIQYQNRPKGSQSKLKTFSDGIKIIKVLFNIFRYYRPFYFFCMFSFAFFLAGIITAIPVFQDWIKYKYIYRLPLAILSVGLEIISLLMFSLGLILDAISRQDKFYFERNYYKK